MALNLKGLKPLGNIIGETTSSKIVFTAKRAPKVGEYILVEYPRSRYGGYVLGIVESSIIGNPALKYDIITPEYVEKARKMKLERHEYMIGTARLLGWINPLIKEKKLITPNYPPKPGAQVYEASDEILNLIFKRDNKDGWVKIGNLINHPHVEVYVDVNAIVSRHLAILAITGAGKSNTVAVLVNRIVNELGGTVLIIDPHNEYEEIAGKDNTNIIEPKIHPAQLTLQELYNLLNLDPGAHKQRMYLRKAYREVEKTRINNPVKFLDELENTVKLYINRFSKDSKSIADLYNKIQELRERYEGTLLSVNAKLNLEEIIVPGKANILQLGELDEEASDVVVYHYTNWLLSERKKYVMNKGREGYPAPVLVVIEEAHILVPNDRPTLTKHVVARIAREGRKFGVGLCLVSQRPKKLDEDALSQTNNKIILKLVEPNDKKYVQRASETLSDELLEMLSGLNTGEAILLGMMTPLPALVKIDEAEFKKTGRDIPVHLEWSKWKNKKKTSEEVNESFDPYDMMEY